MPSVGRDILAHHITSPTPKYDSDTRKRSVAALSLTYWPFVQRKRPAFIKFMQQMACLRLKGVDDGGYEAGGMEEGRLEPLICVCYGLFIGGC